MKTGATVSEEDLLAYEAYCGCCRRVCRATGGRRSRDGLGGAVPVRLAGTQPDGDRRAGSVADGRARPDSDRRAQPTGVYADAKSRAGPQRDSRAQPHGRTVSDGAPGAQPVGDGRAQPDGPPSIARSVQVAPVC